MTLGTLTGKFWVDFCHNVALAINITIAKAGIGPVTSSAENGKAEEEQYNVHAPLVSESGSQHSRTARNVQQLLLCMCCK